MEGTTIDVVVCTRRKKLSKPAGGPNFIATVWGRGYGMRDPVEAPPKQAAAG